MDIDAEDVTSLILDFICDQTVLSLILFRNSWPFHVISTKLKSWIFSACGNRSSVTNPPLLSCSKEYKMSALEYLLISFGVKNSE